MLHMLPFHHNADFCFPWLFSCLTIWSWYNSESRMLQLCDHCTGIAKPRALFLITPQAQRIINIAPISLAHQMFRQRFHLALCGQIYLQDVEGCKLKCIWHLSSLELRPGVRTASKFKSTRSSSTSRAGQPVKWRAWLYLVASNT